jgi:hypothetical protein
VTRAQRESPLTGIPLEERPPANIVDGTDIIRPTESMRSEEWECFHVNTPAAMPTLVAEIHLGPLPQHPIPHIPRSGVLLVFRPPRVGNILNESLCR